MSVLDPARALQILGLSEGADESEIRTAYSALRAHVEARAEASDQVAFRAERRNELLDLVAALRALGSTATPAGVPRWVLGWAVVATVVALAAWIAFFSTSDGSFGPTVVVAGSGDAGEGSGGFAIDTEGEDGDRDGSSGEVESAGERAKLVAKSAVEGSTLEVWTRGEAPELVAHGAADDTVYWLAPGEYALRVSHEDCKGAWEQDLDARGGDEHSFEPEPCEDAGWLVVQSNVPEDELSIDGEKVGGTGAEQHLLPVGEHEVRVSKPGYQAWEGIIDVQPGRVLGIRPRLERSAKTATQPRPERPPVAAGVPRERERGGRFDDSWHEQARQWLLSRYDLDRSGELDSEQELESIPCEFWLGLEASHSQSRLGLTLIRFYGFDGKDWRSGALGIGDEVRDLAHERMTHCGLR